MIKKITQLSLSIALISGFAYAKEISNVGHRNSPNQGNTMLGSCNPSTAITSLDINNVRTIILINGDMWWDAVANVNVARYEIPKNSGKTSLFAGAIWIGGYDNASNLKVAAQTYRQQGSDFWPGPLDLSTTDVSNPTCNKFNRHFKLTREEVEAFTADWATNGSNIDMSLYPVIKDWPGNGTGDQAHLLAPFYDNNGNDLYEPEDGDFPKFYFEKLPSPYPSNSGMDPCGKDILLGDVNLWWVFNDKGNIHVESGGDQIGVEIQAQAFAFATNDDINNMTFYRYKIINRNTTLQLNQAYFGAWVDPDLGDATDDYVQCDVKRGLGICYNSLEFDAGAQGYGANPPASGLDFFEGPEADIGDGIDNDRDSCWDCTKYIESNDSIIRIHDDNSYYTIGNDTATHHPGPYVSLSGDTISGREKIIMSSFVYYINTPPNPGQGDPGTAQEYYNYLSGFWKDGTVFSFGGDGYSGLTCHLTPAVPCKFMFPADTDPKGWGTNGAVTSTSQATCWNWTEEAAGTSGNDRRFMQAAGPFTLTPGAVNYITTGAVWARATGGGRLASVSLLKRADDYAQGLFDHCFKVTNGPDAPDMTIRELNKSFIITLTNDNPLRNNYKENYVEIDPNFTVNSFFRFEGYRIYQLKDATVTAQELCNVDKAREIAHFDIKNGIGPIINFVAGQVPCSNITPAGNNWNAYYAIQDDVVKTPIDNGISHSFIDTVDAFTAGRLINHKTYYFMAVAYAYNSDEVPSIDPYTTPAGKNAPYLAGRNNIKVYAAIPHQISVEMNGTVANSSVGDGPEITRIEGGGHGTRSNSLEFISADNINPDGASELESPPYYIHHPSYQAGRGPVEIKVYDPVKVNGGDFELWATDTSSSGIWVLKNLGSNKADTSHKTLGASYQQIFSDYGFYVNMFQTLNGIGTGMQPGDSAMGAIDAGYEESGKVNQGSNWLGGVKDKDGTTVPTSYYDWIAAGNASTDNKYNWGTSTTQSTGNYQDDNAIWEGILGGTWAPMRFARLSNTTSFNETSPAPPSSLYSAAQKRDIIERAMTSVDVVFTSNRRLWTRCPVIEMQYATANSEGGAAKNTLRKHISWADSLMTTPAAAGDSGFSYFPGYAVDVETGERLNMAFGEDSYIRTAKGFSSDMGADLKWNPDANDTITDPNTGVAYYSFGGKHAVYIFGHVDSTISKPLVPSSQWDTLYMPGYDRGATLGTLLRRTGAVTVVNRGLRQLWATCAWIGYTKLNTGFSGEPVLSGGNDVRVRIRVSKPYQHFSTGTVPANLVSNNGMPHYTFSMGRYASTTGSLDVAKNGLDSINVVPNPYYAYSDYDKKAFDSRIKIVNLPSNCKVRIYTTSGTLIRTLYRDVSNLSEGTSVGGDANNKGLTFDTTIDWDLRNEKGVPVASGIYLIHVEAPGLGERTLKWFGVMRPIDLDTF
jgi:hypothetical protein